MIKVKPVLNSGTLPIICEAITSVSVGSICARSKLQKGLDSYQDDDLSRLRGRWSNALKRRHEYLDDQIKKIMDKQGRHLFSRRRSEHTDQNVELKPTVLFRTIPNSLEIVITWCYRKVSNLTCKLIIKANQKILFFESGQVVKILS